VFDGSPAESLSVFDGVSFEAEALDEAEGFEAFVAVLCECEDVLSRYFTLV
jgi:hypothetical protein